ncbi:MAG: hypothetical protein PHS97_07480 [Oscillospiraceae bacterium]|nr:hypothetical protein [Oscillospiraceae bacterium]
MKVVLLGIGAALLWGLFIGYLVLILRGRVRATKSDVTLSLVLTALWIVAAWLAGGKGSIAAAAYLAYAITCLATAIVELSILRKKKRT